ncbi:MAG: hypothetical protein A3G32_04395 [Deltaproteobacteria bacterium RIFCSPLOWO2_12_FULL_40_28]|nr:MAG: hypothetical protein A3C45_08505 [Deltaproteobacteria bacterium RIFCSPHIGHO2_02_FULL_40_28]OGQ19611.1 MAG: hypothetical protein A3E27_07700 [Deltaproteobacteria bacterium RIFCSPHIGHO2_12_FULL_40_32]OGQ40888.1 MAG: hypothetical protein A3I69_03115 [Deltaproteobacteria bacterium RIFCSPLOWO2_02_FULL_40_36]OGQ54003.1 MAG: hypothetical protein A3G32_04395 [Deltaproteobacteria bacterium RIFCSPLOWO2_12_FULL_40_28]
MKKTFKEFSLIVTGVENIFRRSDFDPVTNFIKWLAIKVAYPLYLLGVTANFLDVLGLFISLFGFQMFYLGVISSNKWLALFGIAFIYIHIFIDFIDGALAKSTQTTSAVGHLLDEMGCYLDRFLLLCVLGLCSGNQWLVVINVFSSYILFVFINTSRHFLDEHPINNFLRKVYIHKYSFLSVRMMLFFLPAVISFFIIKNWSIESLARDLSYAYFILASLWMIGMIPLYKKNT